MSSFVDTSHIRRLSQPPEPPAPELPFPQPDPDDLIDGPRIPLVYGSAATVIWVSKRLWRRTDRGDRFTYQGRWRSVEDWTDTDCLDGKLVRVNRDPTLVGVAVLDDEGFLSVKDPGGDTVWCWLGPKDVTVVPDDKHLNAFERAITQATEGAAGGSRARAQPEASE